MWSSVFSVPRKFDKGAGGNNEETFDFESRLRFFFFFIQKGGKMGASSNCCSRLQNYQAAKPVFDFFYLPVGHAYQKRLGIQA